MRLVKTMSMINQVMVRVLHVIAIHSWLIFVEENCGIAHSPVAHHEHCHWCIFQNIQCIILQLIVIHWWLSIVIEKSELFNHIHVEYSKGSNWEQNWHEEAVHETNVNLSQD